MELNLKATNHNEELIKEFLEKNASEILVDKINNGVFVEVKGKRYLNRKTLKGCMTFITNNARKEAQNGVACVEDSVVFGWAVHYFEEDSIHEKLFNEDGSECKTSKPQETPKKAEKEKLEEQGDKTQNASVGKNDKAKKPNNPQISLFDLLG